MKRILWLAVLVLTLAACGTAGHPAASPSHSRSAATANPQVTDAYGQACAALDNQGYCPGDDPSPPLECSTVIDSTGWKNGPLTELRAIAFLAGYETHIAPAINAGTLDDTELHTLGGLALDMKNYTGSQLSDDASQFASDEESYSQPGPSGGPQDTAYALPMLKDILQLVKDCPGAYSLSKQMFGGNL